MRIQFTVPGVPVGKGRPRFTRGGHAYTPEKTAAFEEKVRPVSYTHLTLPTNREV